MLRLVQLTHPEAGRRVAVVEGSALRLLEEYPSAYRLAEAALGSGRGLAEEAGANLSPRTIDYDPVYEGRSPWRLLPPFDHPDEPARCLISGTGITHKGSAENRQAMHAPGAGEVSDSLKMYRIGLDGGRPTAGAIGAAPEWFYKGPGTIVRAHGEPLDLPDHADDGGEEAELAGVYLIAPDGTPCRVGLVQGNEFSDHVMEARNYLCAAASKLRDCALGPELIVDADFRDVPGVVRIERGPALIWEAAVASGEASMAHSLANLEHHHFKYGVHRRPGDAHIHFLGADHFSYRDKVRLEDGDVMVVAFEGFGRPLRNPLRIDDAAPSAVTVRML